MIEFEVLDTSEFESTKELREMAKRRELIDQIIWESYEIYKQRKLGEFKNEIEQT